MNVTFPRVRRHISRIFLAFPAMFIAAVVLRPHEHQQRAERRERGPGSPVYENKNTAAAMAQVQRPSGSPSVAAVIERLSMIRWLCS